jgi:cell division cycle protein 20 (cofactor of APC complex)
VVDPFQHDQLHVLHRLASTSDNLSSTRTLRANAKSIGRRIPKTPSRILDAPELVDDYYLNLVSWGENNVLAVALGQCVYLWEAETGNIRHLLTLRNEDDFVTSVAWATVRGGCNYIAVGTNHNAVQL